MTGIDIIPGKDTTKIEVVPFSQDQLKVILDKPKETQRLVTKYTAFEVRRNIAIEAPKDQGELGGSFHAFQQNADDIDWYVSSGIGYAAAVNEGSEPHTPPRDPVFRWAIRHNLDPWAVWHNIRKYGTAPNNYVDRAIESAQARVDEFIRRACAETSDSEGKGSAYA